jgi:hypothetical protein
MRQLLLLLIVVCVAATAGAQDWEGDLVGMEAGRLHATLGATFDTQYVWRGFEVFGSKSATHVFADVDLFETGFGIGAVGHYANGSGYVNWTRYDYTLYYQNGVFASQPYATNYRIGYVLYDYPKTVSDWSDMQEMHVVLSWPNLLPIEGLCPSYVAAKTWPSESGSYIGGGASGWFHIFMLDYGFIVPGVIPQFPEHVIKLHGEVVYNDGVNPYGGWDKDSEFSHFVLGASTDLDFGEGVVLTPAVYYQRAMDTGIEWFNDDDNTMWASVSLKYSF